MESPAKPRDLDLQIVSSTSGFRDLAPEWEALLADTAWSSPTQTPLWLMTWWRVFGRGELSIVSFRDGGRLVGVAPLYMAVHWHKPGVPFRRLAFLANGEKEADEISSDGMGIVSRTGYEKRVADALVRVLASDMLGRWDEFYGQRIVTPAPHNAALSHSLRRAGQAPAWTSENESHYIPLPETWDAYLKALSSSRRYRLRRSLRDAEAFLGAPPTLRTVRTQDELRQGLSSLVALHGERWRDAGKRGAFASPYFRAFHEQVMPALLASGALELHFLDGPQGPIASLYNIVWQNRVLFYQCGRWMGGPKKLRPGFVIHALAIRHAIEHGRKEYDFLAGRARYKQELSLAKRELVDFRVVSDRARLREQARRYITDSLREVKRRWMPARP